MSGLPNGGLNIGYEAVDRHVGEGRGGRVALRCVRRDGTAESISYTDLRRLTNRFANVLRALGMARGDRVFTLLGRCPELFTVVLGTLKNTSVLCPLFSAFGPEPVAQRMRLGNARALVTAEELYRRKVAPVRDGLPELEHVLIVGDRSLDLSRTLCFDTLMSRTSLCLPRAPTRWRCCTSRAAPRRTQGCDARARGGRRPPHHGRVRAGPAAG
ncbi:AMP-binding protein [Streptomyces chiangmaiensis]|uniref:AMP-binding protein n=2 Tax=Streptomyces chiangmaiensis TaxID=766497 RepID=A0ABU7FTM7_9ACTN|nr:AMP-binding protein [Streptomyces chiangmaiensis]MED7827182.1 AMP-binding protein [Streptomyces chiangmaiensis]